MSFVEYIRVPDPTVIELLTIPALFLAALLLTTLAGFRGRAALVVTACILAVCIVILSNPRDLDTHETRIGMAVAAILLVILWKWRARKA